MKSVMTSQQHFSQTPKAEIPRSKFDRSHGLKTTFNSGYLVPVFLDEVLPGDTHKCDPTFFGRLATPIAPVMDNIYLDYFFFFVPMRLIWDKTKRFFGEQPNPGDSTDFLIPQVETVPAGTGLINGTIYDYMGIPTKVPNISFNALPFRAYNLIWNEWFRDQNLQTSVLVPTGDGPDPLSTYATLRRGKRHDYFTSALPFPQKGPAVSLPLGSTAPVISNNQTIGVQSAPGVNQRTLFFNASAPNVSYNGAQITGSPGMQFGTQTGLVTDLSTATSATINALRLAFQTQRFYERDARGGSRYTEIIRSHFGVTSPDARLQRPEYLGGGSTPINIHPIAQQSATVAGQTPQGNLAAMGTLSNTSAGFTYSATEHGYIIGMVSVRADLNYQQGMNKIWSRRTKFDHYWPVFAHLGEQTILNKEIYAQGTTADNEVFGYQERYAEYRYKPSIITGQFRSNDATPLDFWHLSQKFGSLPALNANFIQENPPISRVIAVQTGPEFIMDCYFRLISARPMPTYSVPGLIDHL